MQYSLNGSFKDKSSSTSSLSEKWSILQRLDANWWLLARLENNTIVYAPMCFIRFRFLQPHKLTDAERFNIQFPNYDEITNVSDKLKFFRYRQALRQRDVANVIGVDRGTYSRYEENPKELPIKFIIDIAALFNIDPHELLVDDYMRFQFDGQGRQIKAIRKRLGMTQKEFGKCVGVHGGTVKKWEGDKVQLQRATYEKIMSLSK